MVISLCRVPLWCRGVTMPQQRHCCATITSLCRGSFVPRRHCAVTMPLLCHCAMRVPSLCRVPLWCHSAMMPTPHSVPWCHCATTVPLLCRIPLQCHSAIATLCATVPLLCHGHITVPFGVTDTTATRRHQHSMHAPPPPPRVTASPRRRPIPAERCAVAVLSPQMPHADAWQSHGLAEVANYCAESRDRNQWVPVVRLQER